METQSHWSADGPALKCALVELPAYLLRQRWFPAKDAGAPVVSIEQVSPLPIAEPPVALIIWKAAPAHRDRLRLCLPLALVGDVSGVDANAIVGRVPGSANFLIDATALDGVVRSLVTSIFSATANPAGASLHFHRSDALHPDPMSAADATALAIRRSRVEQSNTSIRVGAGAIFKLLRKLEGGTHPELEMGRFLTERAHFAATPALLGWIDWGDTTLAILQAFVANDGDGWTWLVERLRSDPTAAGLTWLQRLGERTGELHMALAADTTDPDFAPEDITATDWQTWKAGVLAMAQRLARDLIDPATLLEEGAGAAAAEFSARAATLERALSGLLPVVGTLKKTRHHGDYHLGQVLVARDDAFIVDFEGEPLRPLAQRRAKHCALRDVAGMLRSFHYAAAVAGLPDDGWLDAATESFLSGYFLRAQHSPGCPPDRRSALRLVRFFAIEKAFYEISYELANRPRWAGIPLTAINRLLAAAADDAGTPIP